MIWGYANNLEFTWAAVSDNKTNTQTTETLLRFCDLSFHLFYVFLRGFICDSVLDVLCISALPLLAWLDRLHV